MKSTEEVPLRLYLFQEVRKDRAAAMQIFSNAGQDEPEKMEAEAKQYVKGPIPSERSFQVPSILILIRPCRANQSKSPRNASRLPRLQLFLQRVRPLHRRSSCGRNRGKDLKQNSEDDLFLQPN